MGEVFTYFFDLGRPEALVVNGILAALLFYGAVALALAMRWADREGAALEEIGDGISKLTADGVVHRENLREYLIQRAGAYQDAMIGSRILDLRRIGASSDIDVAGLSGLTVSKATSRLRSIQALIPIAVMLGLLGTLLGLGTAVEGIAGILDQEALDLNLLRDRLDAAFAGMGTAFSTTILGIAVSLVLRLGLVATRRRIDQLVHKSEQFLVTALVPAFHVSERTALPEAAAALTALNESMSSQMTALVEGVRAEGSSLRTEVAHHFTALEKTFQERASALMQETGRAMGAVLEMLGRREDGAPSLAEYVRSIELATAHLQSSVSSAATLIPQLEESLGDLIRSQGSQLADGLTSYAGRVEPLLDKQLEATNELVTSAAGSARAIERLGPALDRLTESFDRTHHSWERVDALVETVGVASAEAVSSALGDFVRELRADRSQQDAEREQVAVAVAQLQDSLSRTLSRLHDERTAAQRRSLELLEALRESLKLHFQGIADTLGHQQTSTAADLERAVRSLSRELRDLLAQKSCGEIESPDTGQPEVERGFGWPIRPRGQP